MEQNTGQPKEIHTQTVVVVNKPKSVGVAFLLAFFFGPLGLLYATITGGIIMFLVNIVLLFILPVVGLIISWIICIVWAIVAAQNSNKTATQNIVTTRYEK